MKPAKAGIPPEGLQRGPASNCRRSPFYFLALLVYRQAGKGNFYLKFAINEPRTILGGGSLGSCVDEERSQLRELM